MPQNQQTVRYFEVGPNEAGQRIDNFLLKTLKNVPRSHVYRLLRSGQVRVNKGRIKPAYRLIEGDNVRLPPVRQPDTESNRPPDALCHELMSSVIYENEDLLVINKPAGLAVHGGSGLRFGLIEVMRHARKDIDYLELGHRLDRGTSGCLALAKSRSGLTELHEGFRNGRHEKIYHALLQGRWKGDARTISLPLEGHRNVGGERIVLVDEQGKSSQSHFSPLKIWPSASLMEIKIDTGRMHQIRVHAAELGYPIAGDDKYGGQAALKTAKSLGLRRMFLHASKLTLHFDRQPIEVSAAIPTELQSVIEGLGKPDER